MHRVAPVFSTSECEQSKLPDRELLAGNVGQPRGIISRVVDCYVNGNSLRNYSTSAIIIGRLAKFRRGKWQLTVPSILLTSS